jgi:hypothetical protein
LKELGFAVHPRSLSADQRQFVVQEDTDPTCIGELANDIDRHQALLRLFLEEDPRRELVEYWKEMISAGKAHLFGVGLPEMEGLLEGFFPHEMCVSDACLTNADFVWFHKHSYL